jgi:hypothetical protein
MIQAILKSKPRLLAFLLLLAQTRLPFHSDPSLLFFALYCRPFRNSETLGFRFHPHSASCFFTLTLNLLLPCSFFTINSQLCID